MTTRNESNMVLLLVRDAPGLSQADMARKLDWSKCRRRTQ